MKTITIDGVEIEEYGFTALLEHDHPFPSTRDKTITIPGRHGEYDLGAELGPRPFSIRLRVRNELNMNELQWRIRQFTKALLDSCGRPKTVKLVFNYEPDKFYYVRYSGSMPIQRLVRFAEFSLPLVAFDPAAKFIIPSDEIIMDSDVPILSDITLDAVYTFQVSTPQIIQVINDGNIAVRPTILISGTTSRLSVQNMDTDQSFYIDNINQPVEVNGENYTVKIGGVSSLSALQGDFIELLPGYNNIVVDPSGSTVQLTFRFYHQYI
ncbi:phage tail family protein [Geobacillus sp. MMMUD3]|nr:phage tail family protein [Geobacillus sp. MMMUD3]